MEQHPISQISKLFNISTRTLRYYEQIGLIRPVKQFDSAYRLSLWFIPVNVEYRFKGQNQFITGLGISLITYRFTA